MPQSCVVCARPIVHAMCQGDNSRNSDVQKIKKKEYMDEAEEGGERTRRGTNEQTVRELRSNLALMKKSSAQSSFVRCAVQRERDLLYLLFRERQRKNARTSPAPRRAPEPRLRQGRPRPAPSRPRRLRPAPLRPRLLRLRAAPRLRQGRLSNVNYSLLVPPSALPAQASRSTVHPRRLQHRSWGGRLNSDACATLHTRYTQCTSTAHPAPCPQRQYSSFLVLNLVTVLRPLRAFA